MPPRATGWIRPLRSALSDGRLAFLLIAAFAAFHVVGIGRFPLVNRDEPWIAEPGYQFWQHGVYGSELDRGFFGAERHYLGHFPLYSIIVGAAVSLFGPGLAQARLVSLSMAAATAALTFILGRRLLSARHGLLAALVLTTWRITPGVPAQPSGIPLVDLGRLARYDIGPPVAGLAALLIVLPLLAPAGSPDATGGAAPSRSVDSRLGALRLVLAGACAGLAVLCHPAGLAWVGILCVAVWMGRGGLAGVRASGWILAGVLVAGSPYLWFLLNGWTDFMAQQKYLGERYDLLSARFYLENAAREWRRYSQIGRGLQHAQPGAWLIVLCGLTGVWVMWRGGPRHDPGVRVLRLALLVGVALFAVGLQPKVYSYAATLWPLFALTVAMGLVTLLRMPSRAVRAFAGVALIVAVGDGLAGWGRMAGMAASTTPYATLCDRLAARLPPDTRLLALPTYWLGLSTRVQAYRSLLVPMLLASPKLTTGGFEPAAALSAAGANVILLDPPMLEFLSQALDPQNPAYQFRAAANGLRAYLAARSDRHAGLDDPSYGHFEIHYLRPAGAIPAPSP